ncbi:ADP-forming succinate--CoA ligase subunit beta [Limnochorda pilosa]|uniref:Succinate--CoA ligase [ADP-forming] subunit beta n=1 Tax=Limnochorda pilosa TaxID=1555112 RepID=A0A0K2SRK7_LIMPI|nr:ADP-forming succinate--CoA ligase subunit beta [Limnochorda pilosa]BAS29449.1 succinyl-CoA synthetase subunit beta [Limnochorda pilosa]
MRLYEYQAKALFRAAGVPVPDGRVIRSPEEARIAGQALGGRVAVKVQIPIGGRGKAGGVKLASSPEEAEAAARELLGREIRGFTVDRLLVEKAVAIRQEFYVSLTLDRDRQRYVVIASGQGGMDIEELAATMPDRIAKVWLDPLLGLRPFHALNAASRAGIPNDAVPAFQERLAQIARVQEEQDAMLVEINPLALLDDGSLIALDAKVETDDNAAFRHPEWERESSAEADHSLERQARAEGLAYVKLTGNVGVIGNGAGLVMATLDMIQRQGGSPANFLDIGGGAKAEVVRRALQLVLSDRDVSAVLINVFGGITRCDEVARGLLEALDGVQVRAPLVVRLAGTREAEGRALLQGSPMEPAATFLDAARRVVQLAADAPRGDGR